MTIRELKKHIKAARKVAVPVIMEDDVVYLFVEKKDLLMNGLRGNPDNPAPWRIMSSPGGDGILILDVA